MLIRVISPFRTGTVDAEWKKIQACAHWPRINPADARGRRDPFNARVFVTVPVSKKSSKEHAMNVVRVILPLLLAGTAFAQDVKYNYDRSADFSKYRTYKWIQIKDAGRVDQLREQQVVAAIDT